MYKKADLVMLPTDEKATINEKQIVLYRKMSLFHDDDIDKSVGSLLIAKRSVPNSESYLGQHLYVLSDEKIKKGEWQMDSKNRISKFSSVSMNLLGETYKKIIATTDTLNIKKDCSCGATTYEGCSECLSILARIPQSFIEHFVSEYNKDNIITEVMVNYYFDSMNNMQLNVNSDNTINIKPIKDSWSREEVIALLTKSMKECEEYELLNHWSGEYRNLNKWIEENL